MNRPDAPCRLVASTGLVLWFMGAVLEAI